MEVVNNLNNLKDFLKKSTVSRSKQFSWTMVKLKILIGNSLDGSSKRLTNFTKFSKVTVTGNG